MKKEEEDGRLLDRCEAKREQWAKHWHCDERVQNIEDKPWENEELVKLDEALPKAKRVQFGEGVEIVQAKDKSGTAMTSTQKSLLDSTEETRGEEMEFLE